MIKLRERENTEPLKCVNSINIIRFCSLSFARTSAILILFDQRFDKIGVVKHWYISQKKTGK